MKKIITLFTIILVGLLLFSACEPTKKYMDQYNLSNDQSKVKFADTVKFYTLISSDYLKSSVSDIKTNKDFSNAYPADPYLLEVLNNGYNAKSGAQFTITYNYFNPLVPKDSVSYALANGEYGNNNNYYSVITDVYKYLSRNYPSVTRGKMVFLTYNWPNATTRVSNTFVYLGSSWQQVSPIFTAADYTAMAQNFPDFGSTADANFYIPIYIKTKYPYAKSGDLLVAQYALFASSKTTQTLIQLTFNGTSWNVIGSTVPVSSLVNFDGTSWKFPPPVKLVKAADTDLIGVTPIAYTLTHADYLMVTNTTFDDFDRRAGHQEETDDAVISEIGTILKARFPTIAVGQIYTVTYLSFTGTNPAPAATINVKVVPL